MRVDWMLLSLFFCAHAAAQGSYLEFTHRNTGAVRIVQEGKRLVVKTKEGEKVKGKFQSFGEDALLIDGVQLGLSDISAISRKTREAALFGHLLTGVAAIGAASTVAVAVDGADVELIISPLIVTTVAGVGGHGFKKEPRFKLDKWHIRIVQYE